MLHLKAVAYFSLDQAVMGKTAHHGNCLCLGKTSGNENICLSVHPLTVCLPAGDDILSAHSSPLLVDLLDAAIRQASK